MSDLLIGSTSSDDQAVSLIYGSTLLDYGSDPFPLVDADHRFSAFTTGGGGDIDGDGLVDIVVRDHDYLEIYYGHTLRSGVIEGPDAILRDGPEDDCGYTGTGYCNPYYQKTTSIVGDINNDGFDDLLIGRSATERMDGEVNVFLGQ